jgi:predicted nuclease of predicted toxin-antitoxin system
MRWLVDNQLPPALARFLVDQRHDALHVTDVGLGSAHDHALWMWAVHERRVLISKDEDFVPLAHQPSSSGQLVWVKLGNCRRASLIAAFEQSLPAVLTALESQQRVVVLA